ncbi:hypothetical protein N7481_012475 [Penicillium waksmanii]|uniref:uncharacterized protein n=1 Tax=Penicillium waksmanii TaxID=69791 RepID=UPI002548521A|nr:uncharacterized protein N7481_012475 [Penicillium waksmanii]KAJ5965761.1 hypothetical protein N7481_012475 [Penicillium waksmanii]
MNAPPALGYPPGVSLSQTDQVSPTAANFGSNNPFRNRALSPSAGSTSSRPERPRSTNPFLDDTEALSPQSAPGISSGPSMFSPTEKPDATNNTRDLFENLSLGSKPTTPATRGIRPPTDSASRDARGPSSRPRPPRERPSGRPAESRPKDPKDPFDIFADPPPLSKAATSGPPLKAAPADDAAIPSPRERRHRERERQRDGKSRSSRKDRRLDIIDKLDVTSIYGTGMFHHDGPFDACNPHRNRKGSRVAPMQAFPKNSTNMALGGSGPNNSNIDLNLFHGRMEEGYNDFSTSAAQRTGTETVSFDPRSLVDPIHGSETAGLGTSTFLDGAPASRSAMARRQSENDQGLAPSGGLARKKSLAQRLRGKSGTGRMMSPTEPSFPAPAPAAPVGSSQSPSSRNNEPDPYFQDYDEEYDKKAARIQESRLEGGGGRLRSSSSPKQATGLERKSTNDRASDENKLNAGGGGFLNRMKSLRKPRVERRTSD